MNQQNTRRLTLLKTNQGLHEVNIDSVLAEQRMINLFGPITQDSALGFYKQMTELLLKDDQKPIKLLLNSPGGAIDAGKLILDVIEGSPVPVSIYCLSQAYSMAAVIFSAATGGRYLLPNARLMIHQPSINDLSGTASDIQQMSSFLKESERQLFEILSKNSDFTMDELEQKAANDFYLSADEAVRRKLADQIITYNEMIRN